MFIYMTSLIISYDITEESFVEFVTVMLSSNLLIYCYSSILTSGAPKDRRVHEVQRERQIGTKWLKFSVTLQLPA